MLNKTVVLTGASSGIGKELAKILINDYGCEIVGVARNSDKLLMVKNELGDRFIPYEMDVGNLSLFKELESFIINNGLNVSALINCAGVLPKFKRFDGEVSILAKEVFDTNFFSILYGMETFLPIIKKTNSPLIVNVLSSSALCPFAGVSLYSASKSAGERLSECVAYENKKVKILTVMPGFTKTEVMRNQKASEKEIKIIDKISSSPQKVAKKIARYANKGKKRLIIGFDAHFMNFLFKFFPRTAPRLIGWFLKKSKLKLFEEI